MKPRVAFITNLCPYYRRPLYELLADRMETTFFFFSEGREAYLGSAVRHDPGSLPFHDLRRISIAGQPLLIGLAKELRRGRYDVVVKCLNGRLMVPYVYGLARRDGLPFVLWTGMWHHPQTLAHRITRPLTERVYRGSNAIVVYGEHVKNFVESAPGVAPGKTFVAGQAVHSVPFRAVAPAFGEPAEILFVGQLEEHKGIRDLLAAFGSIEDPTVRLRIVGEGSLAAEVSAAARSDLRIHVLGHIPHDGLPAELARARCLVLPAVTTTRYREAWGLVINEAMAAGLPVIATDAVGAVAGGLVRDGQNGLVVREGDPRPLAEAIATLALDAAAARSLGTQARIDVAAFGYERMADAFVQAVAHALGSGGEVASVPSSLRSIPSNQDVA